MVIFREREVSKSTLLISLLVVFFFIVFFGFSFIIRTIKVYRTDDAFIINRLGQIRGSIQRYAKLEIIKSPEAVRIKNYVNKALEEVDAKYLNNKFLESYQQRVKFRESYVKLKRVWKDLENATSVPEIVSLSEKCWNLADQTTTKAQHIAEIKDKQLLNIVENVRNLIFSIIFILVVAIYFFVKKDLEKNATLDSLTLLYNRNYFGSQLQRYIWKSRKDNLPISVIMIDVDFFKKINDTYGHTKGDEVLARIAQIIRKQIRDSDLAFRYGGEEFLVVLPGISLNKARKIAERIREAVKNADFGIRRQVTVSCGVTEYRAGDTLRDFIERADKALYRAKALGRDRCEFL
ncbi:GGDEF domain-containing protein [Desulfurobacterium sp.]